MQVVREVQSLSGIIHSKCFYSGCMFITVNGSIWVHYECLLNDAVGTTHQRAALEHVTVARVGSGVAGHEPEDFGRGREDGTEGHRGQGTRVQHVLGGDKRASRGMNAEKKRQSTRKGQAPASWGSSPPRAPSSSFPTRPVRRATGTAVLCSSSLRF